MNINSNVREINLLDLFSLSWEGRYKILFCSFIASIISIYISLQMPNIYESSALLSVNNTDTESSNSSSLINRYSSIASAAGITLPSSNSEDKSSLAIETIKSKEFTKHLISVDETLIQNIIAAYDYDYESNIIQYDASIFDFKNNKWVREPQGNLGIKPSYLEVHRALLENLNVVKDDETGYIRISFKHFSPVYSKNFLDLVINELNKIIRIKDMLESQKAIDYLLNIQNQTNVKDIKDSFKSLIAKQLQTNMLTNIKDDYILNRIDSPYVPELKISPKRSIIVIFSSIFGLIFGMVYVIGKSILRD